MQRNEPTLPDDFFDTLLRAGYREDGSLDAVIIDALSSESPRARVLALRAGRRRSLLRSDQWLRALDDDNLDVRREALTLLSDCAIEDDALFDRVRELLRDADALVVDAAVYVVGEHLHVAAVDELVRIATTHDDLRCRESAVAALGALGDDRGRAAVLGALEDKPSVRRRAVVALANFEGPDVEAALARASEDRDWQVRAAVDQLGRDED